jgi:hypothetical protein
MPVRLAACVASAALAALLAAACGGSDEPAAERPAATTLASSLSKPVRVRGTYVLDGRRRKVDALIGFDNRTDPYRGSVTAPAPGSRMVSVQLHVLNRGRDPFPLDWARFRGYDERGEPLPPGTESTPLRKTAPRLPVKGQVLTTVAAFAVPRGHQLASIRMRSIVDLWRFGARWTLRP